MSHTTTIDDVVFTDIDALTAAVTELKTKGINISLQKGGTPRAYYTQQEGMGPADYVLKVNDAKYDVGFYKDDKLKGYVARTDLFGGSVANVLGAKAQAGEKPQQAALGKLYQMYAVHAATRHAARQGYAVQRRVKEDGTISLVMNNIN